MTPAFMARATMEGVTLGLGYGMQRFRDLGIQPREIRLTGGGSQSPVWRQICASVFNAETVCLKSAEGAALGAAVQGAAAWQIANGKNSDVSALCKTLVHLEESTRCAPNPDDVAVHQQQLVKLTELTRRLQTSGHL
jgi:xylulokinase